MSIAGVERAARRVRKWPNFGIERIGMMAKKVASQAPAAAPFEFDGLDISVSKLLLDPNNYRFLDRKKFKKKAANRSHEESVQRATLEALEQSYQLDELKHSIITNGYVPMERIIVVPYQAKPGFFLVVEGNRRVASLKSILKEEEEGVRVLPVLRRDRSQCSGRRARQHALSLIRNSSKTQ